MERKVITIDGNKFSDIETFYLEIDQLLTKDLDWEIGHNLDAFNDLLRGGFGVHEYEEQITIIWKNSLKSETNLGFEETINHYTNILQKCHPTSKNSIDKYIELAKQHQGETLFEILINIIREHEHIKFIIEEEKSID